MFHTSKLTTGLSGVRWGGGNFFMSECLYREMSNLITVHSRVRDISYENLFLFLDDVELTSMLVKKSGIALQMNWEMK